MADAVFVDRETGLKVTWVDQGDGTWAPRVAATGGSGGGGGDASGVESRLGATTETAAASDTATSGLNGLFKRLLAGFTTLLSRVPALSSGRVPVDGSGVTQPVSIAATVVTSDSATTAINAKVPALGRAAAAASVPVVESSGRGPVRYTTNTTAVTGGNFTHVQCLTDTVFSAFTRTDATGAITGVTLPAGTVLWGPVTAYTLTSGAVAAYTDA